MPSEAKNEETRARTSASSLRAPHAAFRTPSRRGFTIMELLAVMVLIAILLSITLGAAQWIINVSRDKRKVMTAQALKTALVTYRHEYGKWPVPASMVGSIVNNAVGATGAVNAVIFDMLRSDNATDNPTGIPFLDETTLLTVAKGSRMTLYKARTSSGLSGPFPMVYVNRDGSSGYFNVTIDFDLDTATVSW